MTKRVLIVYEEVPETVSKFLLDLTDEEFDRYKLLEGFYTNASDNDEALEEIASELYEKLFFKDYPFPGVWADKKVESTANVAVDGVIVTGFFL